MYARILPGFVLLIALSSSSTQQSAAQRESGSAVQPQPSAAALVFFVENHNSSRSNKTHIVHPAFPSDSGDISLALIKNIQADLDRLPPDRITEVNVRVILTKFRVPAKVVKKIVIEKGKGGLTRILMLQNPANEAAARAVAVTAEARAG